MEEQVETMMGLHDSGPLRGPMAPQPPSDPKRELLSSIGLFIGMGLLGLGLEPLLAVRWLTV